MRAVQPLHSVGKVTTSRASLVQRQPEAFTVDLSRDCTIRVRFAKLRGRKQKRTPACRLRVDGEQSGRHGDQNVRNNAQDPYPFREQARCELSSAGGPTLTRKAVEFCASLLRVQAAPARHSPLTRGALSCCGLLQWRITCYGASPSAPASRWVPRPRCCSSSPSFRCLSSRSSSTQRALQFCSARCGRGLAGPWASARLPNSDRPVSNTATAAQCTAGGCTI